MFRILIVDDTKSIHSFVKSLFRKPGEVEFGDAFDGKEAVEMIKHGEKYDLILLDWEMPVLNGPNTFTALKESNCQIPVIMMTTKNAVSDIEQMLAAGVSEYMMKPFTVDILVEKIEYVCGRTVIHAA